MIEQKAFVIERGISAASEKEGEMVIVYTFMGTQRNANNSRTFLSPTPRRGSSSQPRAAAGLQAESSRTSLAKGAYKGSLIRARISGPITYPYTAWSPNTSDATRRGYVVISN